MVDFKSYFEYANNEKANYIPCKPKMENNQHYTNVNKYLETDANLLHTQENESNYEDAYSNDNVEKVTFHINIQEIRISI